MATMRPDRKIKKDAKIMPISTIIGVPKVNWSCADQLAKIKEEQEEITDSFYAWYCKGDSVESIKSKWDVLEEICDTITACVTLAHMIGFDEWSIENMLDDVYHKNLRRGYLG